ncbi:GlsB/YeaQ/YmgE family stress response membrane protein [Ketogulonicigenium vulgare]|uniref:GlsB/YeaQ/YmgE family stress response membrane protein n=1 Tax=Ketogulonicigenium vulgare TaxID=92945 RepID=UPI00235923B2|nr:GlsB/YeaQ/YmgE family stress response membrane protein [Ketogulonicigenium vulgare]
MGLGILGNIIIGGLAGWFASMIMKADTGLILNIILGIVGAVLLNIVLAALGIYASDNVVPQLIVGLIGACILIAIGRAVKR